MAKFKLIVVVGFSNSGKSTLMTNLYTRLSSGKVCAQNTKHEVVTCPLGQNPKANVYLGFDGDDRSCVDDNLDRIRNGQYDVAIITLSRASFTSTNTGKGWQKWIDDWLHRNQYPVPFDDYERYYVYRSADGLYHPVAIGTDCDPSFPCCSTGDSVGKAYRRPHGRSVESDCLK